MTKQINQPQTFTIWSDEIKGRIDPSFYRPEFKILEKAFIAGKYKIKIIKEIAEKISSGATPLAGGDAYTNSEEGIPFIRSGNINANKIIDFENLLYVKKEIHQKKLKSSQLKRGDVLIAIVGATIGQISLYDYDREANINQAIAMVRVKKEVNPEYVKEYLLSGIGQSQLNKIKRPVARANINLEEVGSIKIPLPPLPTQNKIVSIMTKAYHEKKEKEAKAKKLLESIDDYVLSELGIKMPEIKKEIVFEVMSNKVENNRIDAQYWQPFLLNIERVLNNFRGKITELGNLAKIFSGARPKGGVGNISNGIPSLGGEHVLSTGEIEKDNLKFISKGFYQQHLNSSVKTDDILLVKDGATTGKVGIIFNNYLHKDCNINEHIFAIRIKNNKKIIPYYVFVLLLSNFGQLQIKRKITGATVTGLTRESVNNLKIIIPPLSIQNKIADKVKFCRDQAQKLKKEADNNLQTAKEKVEKIIFK